MTLPVVLRPAAQSEFDRAFDWYEEQRTGLGEDFVAQVQDALNRISAKPELYPQMFKDVRRVVVQRFPYSVFYRVETEQIVVLAVFHSRRNPKRWQSRA